MGFLTSRVQCGERNGYPAFGAGALMITLFENHLEWRSGVFSTEVANISYSDIISVSYSNGGMMADGWFQISTAGRIYTSKMVNAYSNLQIIANAIEEKRIEIKNANKSFHRQNSTTSSNIAVEDIVKLKNLVDKGVLTEKEFEAAKKKLLGI